MNEVQRVKKQIEAIQVWLVKLSRSHPEARAEIDSCMFEICHIRDAVRIKYQVHFSKTGQTMNIFALNDDDLFRQLERGFIESPNSVKDTTDKMRECITE